MKKSELDIIKGIISEESNPEHLQLVVKVISRRLDYLREVEAVTNMMELTPGTPVRLKGLKPKYLNRAKGTILDLLPDNKVRIEFSAGVDQRARARFGHTVIAPANCVEKMI